MVDLEGFDSPISTISSTPIPIGSSIKSPSTFLSIFILYCLFSTVVFNTLFLFTIGKSRKRATYSLLTCLCAINLCTSFILIPFSFAVHLIPSLMSEKTAPGRISCQIFGVILSFHHRVSTQGFCLLQLERLMVLSKPITCSRRGKKYSAIIGWTINILVSAFFAILPCTLEETFWSAYGKMPSTPACMCNSYRREKQEKTWVRTARMFFLAFDAAGYIVVWLIVFACCLGMLRIACNTRIGPTKLGTFSKTTDLEISKRSSCESVVYGAKVFDISAEIPPIQQRGSMRKASLSVVALSGLHNKHRTTVGTSLEMNLHHLSSESTNSIFSQFSSRKAERKITNMNTKALGTLTVTFIVFTALFIPVIGLRLIFFECEFLKDFSHFHQSLEMASFVAMFMAFSLHPLLNVAADKNLKAEIVKVFKMIISKVGKGSKNPDKYRGDERVEMMNRHKKLPMLNK